MIARPGSLISGGSSADRNPMRPVLRATAALVGITLGVLVAPEIAAGTEPAPGTDDPIREPRPADLAVEALVALESEVIVLVELDAFAQPIPPVLFEAHRDSEQFVADLGTDALMTWLTEADQEGTAALKAMVDARVFPTPAVDLTLRLLDPADLDAVAAGQQISIPAGEYAAALRNLEAMAFGGPLVDPGGPNAPPANQVLPETSQAPTPTPAPDQSEVADTSAAPAHDAPTRTSQSGPSPLLWVGLGLGVVVLAAVVIGLRRSRRPAAAPVDARLDEVLEAGRRVTTVLEAATMRRAAVREAIGLAGAESAALFEVAHGVVHAVVQQPTMFVHPADGALVNRVASTGQPARLVGNDPSLAPVEARAMLVVAVANDGRVIGVIAVARSDQRPFTEIEQDRLSYLAPFIATGLEASSQHSQVTEQSMTDALTSLANRRRLDRDLGDALATRGGTVAFAMVDIDHFKTYNDTHGHPAGDDVLRTVAQILRHNVRPNDVVYRYGGEEFCVLLPDTSTEEASMVAERLRRAVHDTEFPGGESQPEGRLTVSVGVALAEQPDATDLKSRADGALYEAKRSGRDRVVIAPAAEV